MPVDTVGITPRARALAAAIRQLRESCGVSGRELSLKLGLNHGTVSRWETGRSVPTTEDVASLLGALGVTGAEKERLLELARHASDANWLTVGMPGIPSQLAGVVECERAANSITQWTPMAFPGLLQTTDYARSLATSSGLTTVEIESRTMVRTSRREILTRRNPVLLETLIGEAALYEPVGTAELMAEQLHYLITMSKYPNITVRIIPQRTGWHPGWLGPFVLYEFPDSSPVVHFEHFSSGAFVPNSDDVAAYRDALDTMRRKAMSPALTTELIAQVAKEIAPTTEHTE